MYLMAPDYVRSDGDIYSKGAWILHTLRYVIGDDAFFKSLRRMAYNTPQMEKIKDGRQCHFATTDDFRHIAEEVSGKNLDWFFEVYLRQAKLPKLVSQVDHNRLSLHWETPDNLPFPMPVQVKVGDKTEVINASTAASTIELPSNITPVIDPNGRILMAN
jgi:aminopeptidase N